MTFELSNEETDLLIRALAAATAYTYNSNQPLAYRFIGLGNTIFKNLPQGWTPYADDKGKILTPTSDIESIAAKVHESWMQAKRRKGIISWQPRGEELMVPYSELSEQAKDLDRASVRAVLAAIGDRTV